MAQALLIFKPDAAHRLAVRAGIWSWLCTEREWSIKALTWFHPPPELVRSHYDFLQGRPFFPWLVDFMTGLPVVVGRLEAEPAGLEQMRYELGETRIHESRPGSLRERYGIRGLMPKPFSRTDLEAALRWYAELGDRAADRPAPAAEESP